MKPTHLPEFVRGKDYKEPRQTHKIPSRTWRFVTVRGIRLPVKGITDRVIYYHDKAGKVWARHDQFGVYVEPDYAWNGCSPKYWVWPFGFIGTPDIEATRLASLFRDVQYQFARTEHFPLHRSDVDGMFYHCIAMAGEEDVAGVYHWFVRKYGTWADRPKQGEFSTAL